MTGTLRLALVCVALTPVFAVAQQAPLTVAGITARPGEKASGFLAVPAGVDAGTRIPISILRGAQPGPTLALIGGTTERGSSRHLLSFPEGYATIPRLFRIVSADTSGGGRST